MVVREKYALLLNLLTVSYYLSFSQLNNYIIAACISTRLRFSCFFLSFSFCFCFFLFYFIYCKYRYNRMYFAYACGVWVCVCEYLSVWYVVLLGKRSDLCFRYFFFFLYNTLRSMLFKVLRSQSLSSSLCHPRLSYSPRFSPILLLSSQCGMR